MRNLCQNILIAADTATQTSGKIDANQLVSASFHIYFGDATAAGTFKVQASNDPTPQGYSAQQFTPTNWVDIPNATAAITTGGSALITVPNMAYRWIRVVFVYGSGGSTTLNVNMNALSI